jgi:hypothetical protein
MKFTLDEVKSLCTGAEWKLFQESLPENIGQFTLARIKTKAGASRRLYEKWGDRYRDQKRQAQKKEAASRSRDKAWIFKEVLKSFEIQAKKLEREAMLELARKRRKHVADTPAATKQGPRKPGKKKTAASALKKAGPGNRKKIQGHLSSRNKRQQAKRDRV